MTKALISFLFFVEGVFASPSFFEVVAGQVSVSKRGEAHLAIEASDRSIIHWDEFMILEGEKTSFFLPGPESAVLNRVMGGNPTEILGELYSNGKVYLINPEGIFIGKEGIIHTGAFLGSTFDCTNSDFLEGRELLFYGSSSKEIFNQGTIIADSGEIALFSKSLKNLGTLKTEEGKITLGAGGHQMTYFPYGDPRIQIIGEYDQEIDENPYGMAIQSDGWMEAESIWMNGGQGVISHSGHLKGSEIKIFGDQIGLIEEGIIDASGPYGEGAVYIGGKERGEAFLIPNATGVVVEQGVQIFADALEKGNGGKVIIFAEDVLGCYGRIYARGGGLEGDGGFVEVSCRNHFDFHSSVNTLAPNGKNGTLLLDPSTLQITNGATSASIVFGGACGMNTYCDPVTGGGNIQSGAIGMPGTILDNLSLGNVIIDSSPGVGGSGRITFTTDPFTWSGTTTNTFTINAYESILFNANFTNNTTAGAVICNAGLGTSGDIQVASGTTFTHSSTGNLQFIANTSAGSDVFISGMLDVSNADLTITAINSIEVNVAAANLTYNAPGKTATLNAGNTFRLASNTSLLITDGNFDCTAATITTQGASSSFTAMGSGTIDLQATSNLLVQGSFTHSSTGNLTMTATSGQILFGGATTLSNGMITMTAPTVGFVLPASTSYTSPLPWNMTATTGNLSISAPVTLNTAATLTMESGANLQITRVLSNLGTGDIMAHCVGNCLIGSSVNAGAARIGSAGGMTQITVDQDLSIISSSFTPGAVSFIGFSSGGQTGPIEIDVAGLATITANNNQDAGIDSPGTLSLIVGETLSLSTQALAGLTGDAFIRSADTGSISVNDLTLTGFAGGGSAFIEGLAGKLTVISNLDADLMQNSFIRNTGSGKLFLVVDEQAPLPPEIGNGAFNLAATAFLSTGGGDLSIFTATPDQNSVLGLINGATLAEGIEVFETYFSIFAAADPPPFTIFYKSAEVLLTIPSFYRIDIAVAESLQTDLDRTMGWDWVGAFWICSLSDQMEKTRSVFYRKQFEYPLFLQTATSPCEETWINNSRLR